MKKFRVVSEAMRGWKWGYPDGERHGIRGYVPHKTKKGKWIWRSVSAHCYGLTARNVDHYFSTFNIDWNDSGSIHNVALTDIELFELKNEMRVEKLERLLGPTEKSS